jgi:hypothetical protein
MVIVFDWKDFVNYCLKFMICNMPLLQQSVVVVWFMLIQKILDIIRFLKNGWVNGKNKKKNMKY